MHVRSQLVSERWECGAATFATLSGRARLYRRPRRLSVSDIGLRSPQDVLALPLGQQQLLRTGRLSSRRQRNDFQLRVGKLPRQGITPLYGRLDGSLSTVGSLLRLLGCQHLVAPAWPGRRQHPEKAARQPAAAFLSRSARTACSCTGTAGLRLTAGWRTPAGG